MRHIQVLFIILLLTTCATVSSVARLDWEALKVRVQEEPWRPLFPEVDLKTVNFDPFPLRFFLVRIKNPHQKQWVISSQVIQEPAWVEPKTVRLFAQENNLDLAINASFYQKRVQDNLVRPIGLWIAQGKVLNPQHNRFSSFGQKQDGTLSILDPDDDYSQFRWAVGGGVRLLKNGQLSTSDTSIHPRTSLGLTRTNELYLTVIDGRQEHSRGISLVDLARLFLMFEVTDALNLDGGGSSTLVVRQADNTLKVLNSPWDHRLYGGERAVATHLGLRFRE